MSNNPTHTNEWNALKKHRADLTDFQLNDAFKNDHERFKKFSIPFEDVLFDYSKNLITQDTCDLLIKLAKAQNVEEKRDAMFAGEEVNATETRSVLHTALRDPEDRQIEIEDEEIFPFIQGVLQRIVSFKKDLQSGAWTGHTGKAIKQIVNIGIGGSHLGPNLVVDALWPFNQGYFDVHFVSNIDGSDIMRTLSKIDPETTLFIIASKSFTTLETMQNARSAREWMIEKLGSENCIARHFVAVSTNEAQVQKFGIDAHNMFPFRDWVGGRYSLWSSIGLPIILAIGYENFKKLLDGAHTIDQHFKTAPLNQNIPVLMALMGIWYRNFWDAECHAVLPYSEDLSLLPSYLQQVDMESNGKSTDLNDQAIIHYDTAPVVFGEPGTNNQHAFFQMLHQGTSLIPCDFIGFVNSKHNLKDHQKHLLNNMLAQSQALMWGRSLQEADNNPHRVFSGNRPSSTLIFDTLDPYNLGILLALYEHKVFVQGAIWNINSFDQFGVELGKDMARALENGENLDMDSSTRGLLDAIHAKSKG
ncbi:MAG: glucose-6-phosphate isomerase [Pseudomonadota bacterium]